MVDYSKIDFKKCKLEPISGIFVDVTKTKLSVSICSAETGVAMLRKERDSVWKTDQGSLYLEYGDLNKLFNRGGFVDAFIAAETARIEAEEAAKNWVVVPWQDVDFLLSHNVTIEHSWTNREDGREVWSALNKSPTAPHLWSYRADRRTFPSGYDPEKPRWVDIERSDVVRLERSGCAIQRRASDAHDDWMARGFPGDPPSGKCDYRVDMHTVPPGVTLHEEPKPVTKEKKTRVVAETPVTLLGDSHIRFDYEFIKKSMAKESVDKNPRIALIVDEEP